MVPTRTPPNLDSSGGRVLRDLDGTHLGAGQIACLFGETLRCNRCENQCHEKRWTESTHGLASSCEGRKDPGTLAAVYPSGTSRSSVLRRRRCKLTTQEPAPAPIALYLR
jgi:hypothetical protein